MNTDLSDLDSLFKEVRTAFFKQEAAKPPTPSKTERSVSWKPLRVVLLYQKSIIEPLGLFQEWSCGGARRYTRLPDEPSIKSEAEVIL